MDSAPQPPPPPCPVRPAALKSEEKPKQPVFDGIGGLRKARQWSLFENLDDSAMDFKTPTAKMRLLDAFRYHKPTAEEQLQYNLPGSLERLSMHKLNDVMSVCLARKGKRFTSSQIQSLSLLLTELSGVFDSVDIAFKSLSPGVLRYKPPVDGSISTLVSGSDLEIHNAALAFHTLCNTYIALFRRLKDLVIDIRAHSVVATGLVEVPNAQDSDDSAKAPFPTFLFVLIQKYRRERADFAIHDPKSPSTPPLPTHPWWPTDSHPPLDSLAQFALFLAAVLVQRVPFLKVELEGMVVLLQVLKVEHTAMEDSLHVHLHGPQKSNYVLSRSIFEFLSTVRELRSIPKRKELLENPRRGQKKLRRNPTPNCSNDK
ncbi:hypothetical protein, variant 3 [Aphanomyces invadans]|uniref:Uncharacterized protein n=2 Tax=Aphanomyces invadans TaxID=157072 RepID=A0A024USX2_9STRA|nr:hypothetical protein, variant 2 [Aphanomyces invadans]XP_008862862.1 hypothetical protein, variant 3 [Aphanomyces invadans]ETW09054.1 hypothetical protein, variant 2 [Aphanomyces invadans]ETW09055.1 hypothetical protein, variant 3 [Aphanomyces invadans]|eukprot:XP_008862861.1 hypothetical protein, variant 2 [Aphanomyces invadans]